MQKLMNTQVNPSKGIKPDNGMSRKTISSLAFNNHMKKKSSAIMFFANQKTNQIPDYNSGR